MITDEHTIKAYVDKRASQLMYQYDCAVLGRSTPGMDTACAQLAELRLLLKSFGFGPSQLPVVPRITTPWLPE